MGSLMNGLSAFGASVSSFAGAAGLEQQRASLAQQQTVLADQLAATRETAGRVQAGDIAATAATKEQDFRTGLQGQQQTFQAGQTDKQLAATASQGDLNRKSEEARTQLEVGKPTGELQMARALAGPGATQEQLADALTTVLSGKAKYSFAPATTLDPDTGKPISGVNRQNTRTGDIEFVPTGTDPNRAGSGGGGVGNRAEVQNARVAAAATMAAESARNIMELPSGSSTGYFGGRNQGGSLMGAVKETLTNALTSQDVQSYNVMLAGITRNLSTIETSGLAPNAGFTKSMESVILKEGDTEITKMRKMAEIRQIVEFGLEAGLSNPRLPDVQKDQLRGVIAKIQTAIPFTHHDVTVLERTPNGKMTMNDLVKAKGLGGAAAAPTAAGTPSPSAPMTPQQMYGGSAPAPVAAPTGGNIIRYDANGNRISD